MSSNSFNNSFFYLGKIGSGKVSKTSPSPSSSSTTSEDWTLVENSEPGKSQKSQNQSNKIMNAFNKIKHGRKGSIGNCATSPDNQVCHRCKQVSTEICRIKHHLQLIHFIITIFLQFF